MHAWLVRHVKVRGQLEGIGSLLFLCRSLGSNSGSQAWWQGLFPAELSCQTTSGNISAVIYIKQGLFFNE